MRPRCVQRGLGQLTCDMSSKLKVWYESLFPCLIVQAAVLSRLRAGRGGELEERPCLGLGWRTEALRRRAEAGSWRRTK